MLPRTLPAERSSRWALASKLIEDWFGAPPKPPAEPPSVADIAAAERRLGLALPQALCELHLGWGHRCDVWNVQDHLIALGRLKVEEDRLVLFRENQNVVQWWIPVAALDLPDPPVSVSDFEAMGAHHEAAPSVSEFALQMLALNAKFSNRPLPRANGQVGDEAVQEIERSLLRLPIPDLHWPPFPTRFYGNENLIVEIQSHTWIWITALESGALTTAMRLAEAGGVAWEGATEG